MAIQSYGGSGLFGQPSFGDYSRLSGGVPVQMTPEQIQQQLAYQQDQYGGLDIYQDLYNTQEASGFLQNVNARQRLPTNPYVNPPPDLLRTALSQADYIKQQQGIPVEAINQMDVRKDLPPAPNGQMWEFDANSNQYVLVDDPLSNLSQDASQTVPVASAQQVARPAPPLAPTAPPAPTSVLGMFPEVEAMQRALYQQKQNEAMQAQALQFARLDPFQKASYGLAMGGQQLGDAIGGALGGKDPQLQMIAQRQQMLGMIDPNKPETYGRAIQFALQTGDRNTALMLNDEMKNAQARKNQALNTYAQQLLPTLKNADGTINEQVKSQLLAFPQGRAAISELAKVIPDLRRIGAAGGQEDDPFAVFTQDATIPANVKTVAAQYSKSLKDGVLDPEKVDAKVRELADMTQRAQQFEQNQAQIKAQQQVLNSLKEQGLENSTQALGIQRSLLALQQQNATFNQQTKLAEIDRKKEEAAVKAEAAKNKPLPANLSKAEEEDFDVATTTTNLATDAYSFVNRIKSGDIKFGLKDRASILARSKFGSGAPDVIARRDYDKFVERLVSENLRLNKGTQTDKDFERELSLLQSAESAEDAAQIMNNLVNINVRKTQDAATAISRRRVNAGFGEPPVGVSVPKFEPYTFTQKEVDAFLKNPKYPSGTIFVDPDGKRKVKP